MSDSDSDDLFTFVGKDKIREKFKKELPTPKKEEAVVHTSIFNSDEEERKEESKPEKPKRGSRKRSQTTEENASKEGDPNGKASKFDPQRFLEQIQNASKLEADRRKSELKIVEAIDRDTSMLIDKMQETEKEMERQRSMRLQSVDEIQNVTEVEETPKAAETPVPATLSSVVNILQDEEAEEAIDGNYKEVAGMVTLILRIGEDERKVAIRMPFKSPFQELLSSLPACGCPNGRVMFDGVLLNPKLTPEGLDVENGDILDVEV
ncbi:hypothetical protein WA538_005097 [Blastocystis sp. DL]